MTDQTVSKIVNIVSFKTDNNSYNAALKKIRRVAGAFSAATNQYNKSMAAGKQIAGSQAKAQDKLIRAEIKANKTRRDILKADQIRYKDQIKNNSEFHKGLQRVNNEFLRGTLSFKERSAQIGQLNKQYKALNNNASKHNSLTNGVRKIGSRIASGASTMALGGAAMVGGTAYAANRGYNTIKDTGQQFEALTIGLMNTFGNRAVEISQKIAEMARLNGSPIVDLGNNLVEFVSLMKPLGLSIDDSIKRFQQTQDAMQSYGIGGERAAGFQTQLTQLLDQGTLDSFKEAFAWAPQLRADLLQYVQKSMGVSQKDFLGGLTNGKFDFKKIWFDFLNANSKKYSSMSSLFKQSSMANDARASNQVSIAIYRIFESSGFKQAMKATTDILNYWGILLESNASKIGEIFGNLYSVVRDLSKDGFEQLSQWLKELSKEDIKGYFGDLKTSMVQFADVMKRLVSFLDSVLPKKSGADEKGQYYIKREKYWLDQGYSGKEAGRLAEGEMRKQYQLGFTVPTLENSLVRMNAQNNSSSNHKATLDLKINTEINQPKINEYVWASIAEDKTRDFNMLLNGFN
ncbi:hypothetical protein V3429_02220 [Aeromonas jandaei]|uniref:hypothetical protein n=1 Tax=Aeromonas jandaei TaxID=650 RepID=UPI0030D44F02